MQRHEVESRTGQGWKDLAEDFRDSDCGKAGTRLIEALRERILVLVRDSAQTRRDIDLSDIGRERKLRRLGAEARLDEPIASARERWHDALVEREGSLKRAIAEATRVGPPQAQFEISLDSEIRAHLRSLDKEQRLGLLNQAAQRGETQPLRAVFTAPAFLSGLSDSEAGHIRQRAGGSKAVAETRELQLLQRAADIVKTAEKGFERLVLELTEDPGSHWRAEADRTETSQPDHSGLEGRSPFEN